MLPVRRSGVRLIQCSCVGAFVVDLIIIGCSFSDSTTFRMSTRRLPVILFVSRFECPLYPVVCCTVCLWWPRWYIIYLLPMAGQYFKTLSWSFAYHPPPAASIGYTPTSPLTLMLMVVQFTVFVLTLAIFITCQLAALQACVFLPPFRWLPVRLG